MKLLVNIKKLVNKMDKPLLIITIALFLFGLLNIVTASSREAVVQYGVSTYHYFFRQLIMLGIGTFLSYILLNLDTKLYKKIIPFVFVFILMLVLALFKFGEEINGAINWLPLPFIGSIQPSEFAKPIIIIYVSLLFEKYYRILKTENDIKKRYEKLGFILIVACIIPILTFIQKDLGSMMIMMLTFGIMFFVGPLKKIDKLRTVLLGIVVVTIAIMGLKIKQGYILSPAQMERFDYYNPCSKYETSGYQICNGFIAINDGSIFGLGIGKSKQKYSYIPHPHTDSVFAIIGEEYGLLRCSFIFLAFLYVLYRILRIASRATTIRGKYICLGIASYIFIHIFLNLGGLFGLIPLTGVPLPFLSYGGSYAISLMCSLAVVQRINIETKSEKIKINN
ncbi:MAG: FtsW/RodA/SpoVE family cell cycle protein [Bacilli bacterium]